MLSDPKLEKIRLANLVAAKVTERKQERAAIAELRTLANKEPGKAGRPLHCGKCNKMKSICKCGRPTKATPEVVDKWVEAFSVGATDREACAYAGVSSTVLENYIAKNPEFGEEKEDLKLLPLIKARHNVVGAIAKGDVNHSEWYLERKRRREFSTQKNIEGDGERKFGVIILPATTPIDVEAAGVIPPPVKKLHDGEES